MKEERLGIGPRKIVKEPDGRYKIYLPARLNALWRKLQEKPVWVEVRWYKDVE